MNPKAINQVTLHDHVHTPVSGQIGPVLSKKATATTKAVSFDFETIGPQLFLVVIGSTKVGKFRILVPMTQVKNIDIDLSYKEEPTLKAAK